jgi:hypothetical protein
MSQVPGFGHVTSYFCSTLLHSHWVECHTFLFLVDGEAVLITLWSRSRTPYCYHSKKKKRGPNPWGKKYEVFT